MHTYRRYSVVASDHTMVPRPKVQKTNFGAVSNRSSNIGRDKSFVDDLNIEQGIVSTRVAFVPRSAEIQPLFLRFVIFLFYSYCCLFRICSFLPSFLLSIFDFIFFPSKISKSNLKFMLPVYFPKKRSETKRSEAMQDKEPEPTSTQARENEQKTKSKTKKEKDICFLSTL